MHGKPITINEGFLCKKCGKASPKANKTCRNHCRDCLFSLHVDRDAPGDRLSACFGLMEPVFIDYHGKKGYQIKHHCQKCGKVVNNIVAGDDNMEEVTKIMQRQNLETTPPNEKN
jgi:predicted nucleic acid-binding Zn ribbon protein